MPKELEKKCRLIIHSATTTSAAAGAIPIPMSDAIPITGAQIAMIIGLGKVFDITLSTAAALTKMLGWVIADDFYRISQGEEPENIVESASDLKGAFDGLRFGSKFDEIKG